MTIRSTLLLAAAAVASASGAHAQTYIYGAGASLPAPYIRQAADCYGVKLSLAFRSTAATQDLLDFNFTKTPVFNCAPVALGGNGEVNPDAGISYISTGSGRGILGFFTHNGAVNPAAWLGSPAPTGGTQPPLGYAPADNVQFGASETAIGQTPVPPPAGQSGVTTPGVDTYNLGGAINANASAASVASVAAPGVAPVGALQFRNPRASYGPMIQIPLLIAPITVAFDNVYKKVNVGGTITEYRFKYSGFRSDGSGGLDMTRETMCRIFNGQITNWGQVPGISKQTTPVADPEVYTAPAGAATGNNLNIPLTIVGRSDSSGTTSGWTRHLAKVCATIPGVTNNYANSTPTLPGTLVGATYDKNTANNSVTDVPGRYTIADGSDGVAKYLDFSASPALGETLKQGRIGYLGSDYVLPYVRVTGQNTYDLATADIQNANGKFIQAKASSVSSAFKNILPPQSTSNGTYSAVAAGNRANPAAGDGSTPVWVQISDTAATLADPIPVVTTAQYPIVTTTNALIYTCYKNLAELAVVRDFFNWYYSSKTVNDTSAGILARAGFSPVPTSFQKAIRETFFTPVTATRPLKLRVQQAGTAPVTSGVTEDQCLAVSPGA